MLLCICDFFPLFLEDLQLQMMTVVQNFNILFGRLCTKKWTSDTIMKCSVTLVARVPVNTSVKPHQQLNLEENEPHEEN